MAARARVDVNSEKIREYLRLPDGPIARRLLVIGEDVKVRTIASLKDGFPRDFLGPKILKRAVREDDGIHVHVGADRIHTQPHVIRGNPLLVFDWPKAGLHPAVFHMVNHPGSDFTKYLTRKLREALDATHGGTP